MTSRLALCDDVALTTVDLQPVALADAVSPRVTQIVADAGAPAGQACFAGADVVIHLATRFDADRDGTNPSSLDLATTESILAAATTYGVQKLIVMSSAMVYGARPSNPIPLTEAAPVDPDPDSAFATTKAAIERASTAWVEDVKDRSLVIFRPTTSLGEGQSSWVARTLRASAGLAGDHEPPLQFLHLDDLADAVVLAATDDLSGIYNVAPDGWIDGYEVRQLVGTAPRVRLPLPVAAQVAAAGWRNRLAATPPGILSYTQFPWVVANDRIRAAGWAPTRSSAEVYVESVPARPWAMVNARQRQRFATAGAIAMVIAGSALALWLLRWLRRS